MESRDRIGKILLVTLVLILGFVVYKRTSSTPAAVTYVEDKSATKSLLVKDDVEKIVRDFIISNPDVLIESIEKMHKRKMDEMNAQAGEMIKKYKADLEGDKVWPAQGSGAHSITMIYDYGCTYCKKANQAIDQLLEKRKDVKVIYKPYPILGEGSEYITKVILSVYKLFPDKFKSVHTSLMNQKIAAREDVVRILDLYNIPVANVEAAFESPDIKASQHKFAVIANDIRIQAVPAFIINDTLYPGVLEVEKIESLLRADKPSAPAEAPAQIPVDAKPVVEEAKDKHATEEVSVKELEDALKEVDIHEHSGALDSEVKETSEEKPAAPESNTAAPEGAADAKKPVAEEQPKKE